MHMLSEPLLRLVGGRSEREGRLEVCAGEELTWSTVDRSSLSHSTLPGLACNTMGHSQHSKWI